MGSAVVPQAIVTRPAVDSDRAFLVDCFLRAMRPSFTLRRGAWNEREERDRFEGALDLDRTTIIETDDARIGFVVLVELRHVLQVHTIAIAPEHQGRGIGTEVLRDVVNIGRQTGREVVLSVLKVNARAEALYRRLGFEVRESSEDHLHLQFAR